MAEEKTNKSRIAEKEEEILKFWQDNKIFEKSLEKPAPNGDFVFYDGPPFATGLPHYGHILPGTIKDVIPRFETMRGKKVVRKWGWDCHGLPVENLIEKELGLSSKKDIETYGIKKFNEAARNSVMRYADDWKKIIPRVGRWVDMENDYKTMDTTYTESVWWAFKNLFNKGLVYKSFKAMHLCPHCETTLSNFEVNQGYKDITDISVYVKFKVVGEENTYFLAWTTTPWTLPGNVALAVNKEVEYVKVKKDGLFLIIAKELAEKVLKDNFEIVEAFLGKNIINKKYEPLFSYYNNEKLENREKGFKVYHGDFVTTEDGTGIVHIAPAFGEDDMNLGKQENLPFIQHVNIDGTFKKEVTDFAGEKVKPKDDHQKADVEIIKFLAKAGTLFEKEKMIHSYPHCWRCETPLLNYATTSWFVKVTDLKDKLIKINEKISWAPEDIGQGRFGKWLEGARDWAISRSRYWGAPLPVWQNEKGDPTVIGSIEDLKKYLPQSGNKYFLMRHGQSVSNTKRQISVFASGNDPLTEKGREQTIKAAKDLKKDRIDVIITSPFMRTKQTAEIVGEEIGFQGKIEEDARLEELKIPGWHGRKWGEFQSKFSNKERFEMRLEDSENWEDVRRRISEFMFEIDKKYQNKNILLVSHGGSLALLLYASRGLSVKQMMNVKQDGLFKNAEVKKVDWWQFPHNENFEIDLHRPYIDEIKLINEKGEPLKRVQEVFDCWFESGSMPYAQFHYPFENKKSFEKKNFPAEFIAEGLDQTRGWFYTLLVLSVGLFKKSPFKSVVVNGMVLAEDGRKMSKMLKNYPEISYIVDKYGADSLRYYLMSSPAVKAEDLNFSEKGVDEVSKKIILKLENVLSFYEMYADKDAINKIKRENPEHILDKWILARFGELQKNITESLEARRIDSASRPILGFIDDFSTWYIRRSRDRFKSENLEDKNNALVNTRFILVELAKCMAPFMPFFAESIYLRLRTEEDLESVHLCDWPKELKVDKGILKNMEEVRKVVSLALEKRMTANIKVRQPLNELSIKNFELKGKEEYLELIKDEVNIKNISFDEKLETEVLLDTEITPGLQKEGNVREFVRAVQELRKNKNLKPQDSIKLLVETNELGKEFLRSVENEIVKPTNISEIVFENTEGEEIKIGNLEFKVKIEN
ncbi:MAG: class I tRNA ligase family protein [Parcubacteria group bacterium]|nr:class I tRNA ligase family protein [Parcubacteria group bacterium]